MNDLDKLLNALRADDKALVDVLATELFVTRNGQPNYVEINKFQSYAPCKIFPLEQDSFGWLIGGIKYNGVTYSFG